MKPPNIKKIFVYGVSWSPEQAVKSLFLAHGYYDNQNLAMKAPEMSSFLLSEPFIEAFVLYAGYDTFGMPYVFAN